MRFFPATLDRAASDATAGRISAHFAEHGWGWWAVEVPGVTLVRRIRRAVARSRYETPFTPAVEVGWRLARAHWGRGYATEGARAAVAFGFGDVGLDEIVSMTTPSNLPSRRVMEKLGMTRDPADDFDHPRVPERQPVAPARAVPAGKTCHTCVTP